MPNRLTAVIITKDEEDRITRCLNSIGWVDEIVVVDDMSSDKTVQICQLKGARVIRNESFGNFDHQRNLGIEAATGDWILQMDADEVVPEQLRNEIEEILKKPSTFAAYKFKRKNFFLNHFMRYGGWYGYSTKLFKKGKARYIGRSVHETLKVDGEVDIIQSDIEHFPFKSLFQFTEKQNFYTSVEARLLWEQKGRLTDGEIGYNLKIKPIKLFWKLYIKKRGLREGMYGLIFCLLYAWLHFLKWAKYWEIIRDNQFVKDSDRIHRT